MGKFGKFRDVPVILFLRAYLKTRIRSAYVEEKEKTQPVQESDSGKGLKRKAVTAIRWGAWILVLCLLLTQIAGNAADDLTTLGQFVIAGQLCAISVVPERKYKW